MPRLRVVDSCYFSDHDCGDGVPEAASDACSYYEMTLRRFEAMQMMRLATVADRLLKYQRADC